ncbi:nicotine dehydrogenase chain A (plasmid) [Geobacillus kaustophilus HTA426]|uniref:Nicotine dehydrogenase chain A n=1 Tax=Geobacillus kaustophilus (strain HTA426) TaxID=235909 RepID=Q5QL48_GEOKA|nr:xanthine dehydrogenase family protein subunit M [Geobacillus kaustophilus]BAD74262.1 nicotine dehydrogenase chain A [Geobacillus kaustophilus HTA426]
MKPPLFDYYKPETVDQALELLQEYGINGKIIAGGQSMMPILNMRLSTPELLIDISGLQELSYIRVEDGFLKIGALTRQRDVELSPLVREACPLLSEAIPYIGHMQTRNRGTFGGSLAHADPTAEIPMTLLALDAQAVIRSASDQRLVKMEDFFLTYLTTDLMPEEMLTEVQIPLNEMPKGYAFTEFSRRHGDFALVAAACLLDVDKDGHITSGRLVLGGVDSVPLAVHEAVEAMIGSVLTEELLEHSVEEAIRFLEPESDLHASSEFRKHLAKVFAMKAIRTAYQRAQNRE